MAVGSEDVDMTRSESNGGNDTLYEVEGHEWELTRPPLSGLVTLMWGTVHTGLDPPILPGIPLTESCP